jgi:hypothetical protein
MSGASANIGVQDISYNQGLDDTGKYVEIKAIKLELGTEQTLAHQENGAWVLNSVPKYEEQLILCQTSTIDLNDAYANKTLETTDRFIVLDTGNVTLADQTWSA